MPTEGWLLLVNSGGQLLGPVIASWAPGSADRLDETGWMGASKEGDHEGRPDGINMA